MSITETANFNRSVVMKDLKIRFLLYSAIAIAISLAANLQAVEADDMKLKSAGPIAFGPDGLLLISDPMDATIYALETGDTAGSSDGVKIEVKDVRGKVASMMGAKPDDVRINDLAVNPVNGRPYLSVTRGSGENEVSTILTIDPKTMAVAEFDFADKKFTKTSLPNPAESRQTRRGNQRLQAITDMAFVDGQIYVAGLSNEEFASNLRAISYPFSESNNGCSIEIYHGAHGKFETRSPIRTFAALTIDDEVNLLAAYTCTPLVRIPVGQLKPESKVKGTTIAELGNRNNPLDMVVYEKDGTNYALMANSSRGVMKIDLTNAGDTTPITTRVEGGGVAGIPYEKIAALEGVMQLDGLGKTHAVILVRNKDGSENLQTIVLP
jgi:hypothetical protein